MAPKKRAAVKSKASKTAKAPEPSDDEGSTRRGRARSRGDSEDAEAEPEAKKARTRSSSSEISDENGKSGDADREAPRKGNPMAINEAAPVQGEDGTEEPNEKPVPEEEVKSQADEAEESQHEELEKPQPDVQVESKAAQAPREEMEYAPDITHQPQQEALSAAVPVAVASAESQPVLEQRQQLASDPNLPPPVGLHDEFYMLTSPDGMSAVVDVHPRKCGAVIGSRGAVIHGMQERSGARIKLNQDFPDGEMRKLTITGSQEQVLACAELVKRVLEPGGGSHSIHENAMSGGDVITEVVMCPPTLVGRVVGRGGGNVREVQSRSGARVQVNQQFPEGQDRQVEITGTEAAVKSAIELVKYIMENGPVLPAPGMPLVAGGGGHSGGGHGGASAAGLAPGTAAVTVECPKACIGRVIGRGGETVSRIQRETQAKVHIDQNVPEGAPVKVNISGYEPAVHAAIKLVQDIMVNGSAGFGGSGGGGGYGHQSHGGYGGGGRGGGGGGGGGGYGGHSASTYGPGSGASHGGSGAGHYGGGGYGGQGGYGGYGGQGGGGQYGGFGGGAPPRSGAPGGLAPGWAEYKDQNGTPYYHNAATGVTQWDRPQA